MAGQRNVASSFGCRQSVRTSYRSRTPGAVAGAVAASAFLLPALGFALGPVFEPHHQRWQQVGTVDEFPITTYVPKVMTISTDSGEAGKTTVYIRKYDPARDTESAIRSYLDRFDPSFIGLTGDLRTITAIGRPLAVAVDKGVLKL